MFLASAFYDVALELKIPQVLKKMHVNVMNPAYLAILIMEPYKPKIV